MMLNRLGADIETQFRRRSTLPSINTVPTILLLILSTVKLLHTKYCFRRLPGLPGHTVWSVYALDGRQ